MRWNRSSRLGVAAGLLVVMLGILGGVAQAAPGEPRPPGCNPDGRYICITIDDVDEVSHSVANGVTRYTSYTVVVSNGGSSTLTNGSATFTLKDVIGSTEGDTTGRVVAVPSDCTATPTGSTSSFTCPLANLPAGGEAPPFSFFAATSTDADADFLRLKVTVTANEQASDNPDNASQTDEFTLDEDTDLEPEPDFSQSVFFFGGSTMLQTALLGATGANDQTTMFEVPVMGAVTGVASLEEFSHPDPDSCPVVGCFGQNIRATVTAGVFSASNPANLLTTMNISVLPRGVSERSLTIHNEIDEPFTDKCSGAVGETPDADELPCRRVVIDRRAGIVTIDIWAPHQGDWGFS
jgi:hypothetical protein